MARYGFHLTAGRARLNVRFNDTILFSMNATGLSFFNVAPVARPAAYTLAGTVSRTMAADTSADFPAGGVGAAAGGWDTAANRDLAITRFNALRADVNIIRNNLRQLLTDTNGYGLTQ